MRYLFILLGISVFGNPGSAMSLIQPGDATHTAVSNGPWHQASTWDNGVPGAGNVALIPLGVAVTLDGGSAEVRQLLIQGTLTFATSQSSNMLVDTIEVAETGALYIGSVGAPMAEHAQVQINFISDGDIDVATDPALLGRGLIANGRVHVHGQPKTVHVKLAMDPQAGESVLQLAEAPSGWRVGDRVVLTGTRYSGWKWDNDILAVRYHGTQDEVRFITALSGTSVTLDSPLEFDHLTPRADLKASLANFSRNITFRSDAGVAAALHRRGHVMLMQHTDYDIRYAAFEELGRTDKSVPSFDLDQLATVTASSNVRGRYPLHFHITGIDDPTNPAMAVGNAVFASPGWGLVHHASNAVFHDNASFDTHGAGFVAETGDEIGSWTRNIAIRAEGNSAFNPKNGNDVGSFDMARSGAGFWFQGRMVRTVGNVAASVNHGYVYLHRGTRMRSFPGSAFMLPEALRRDTNSSPDDAPILNFHNNESFASTVGLYVVKANPNQEHDIHSHLSDFRAWEVRAGAALEYTSHYLLSDFDIIGKTPEPFSNALFGIEFGTNTSDMVINGAHIVDVATGLRLFKDFTDPVPPEVNQYVIIDVSFDNVVDLYEELDLSVDTLISSADLVPGRMEVTLNGGDPLEYLSPATSAGSGIVFEGVKLDSIGASPIPAGTDELGVPSYDMIAICAQEGYYRSADGEPYVIVEEYFTERASGRIHKFGLLVFLGPDVEALLGDQFHAWRDAFERGTIDLASQSPVALDDYAQTAPETEVIIDVLANDSDPDGDTLIVDGVVQPVNGLVFVNVDGTLSYRPDLDFVGEDRFQYWASDDNGNFSPAEVIVIVGGDVLFADGFEG